MSPTFQLIEGDQGRVLKWKRCTHRTLRRAESIPGIVCAATDGSETVITFGFATGSATRARQGRRSTRAQRVAALIGVYAVEETPKTSEDQTSQQHG
jgi:hypothetical protein